MRRKLVYPRSWSGKPAVSAVEHQDIPFQRPCAKSNPIALAVKLDADRVAGERGIGEARGHGSEPLGRARREAFQDGAAREAEGVEAVRYRPVEARGARDLRVRVDRHVIAAGLSIE